MAYKHVTIEQYQKELWALPDDQKDLVNGWSPGFVAARLGITRQAVYQAIKRDKLHAYRISETGKPQSRLLSLIITEASVREWQNSETRYKHTPKELRATAR